jgi:uncharacterized protein (DUF1015 family)
MANIQAFRALRYDLARVGRLADVVAPPYDVIDAAAQALLYERHSENVVRLILNRAQPGDMPEDGYRRAALLLKSWLRVGIIQQDNRAAIYVYHQTFELDGGPVTRRGFITRLRLEPFGEGRVYPHEQTHANAKQDRLLLMRHTQTNLCPIFGLYQDSANEVQDLIESAIDDRTPLEATDDLGVKHELWAVTDMAAISRVAELMGDKAIFIADGHHRYETACNYLRELSEAQGSFSPDHPANYVMTTFVGMSDPGLVIMPTHRLFRGVPPMTSRDLVTKLGDAFETEVCGQGSTVASDVWEMIEIEGQQSTLAFYTAKDGCWLLARLTESGRQRMEMVSNRSVEWNSLGVALLHALVMDVLLDLRDLPSPRYVRKIDELVSAIDLGDALGRDATGQIGTGQKFELASMLLPATVEHVRQISLNCERMPAKSTYFYPKLLSGLVFNPVY